MNLKQLRTDRKLTIANLSQILDLDPGNLSKIEQGKLKPSLPVLMKYSNYFKVSIDNLVGQSSVDFISAFRSAAPYIHHYRNKIFVIAFDGFALESNSFVNLCTDINLLHSLGIKIILIHGIRPFIDLRLDKNNIKSRFHKHQRITTAEMMPHIIEANGLVKTKIEAALSSNIYHNNIFKSELKISSGNFLMAKPRGVIDGVDMEQTGVIREINHEAIIEKLNHDEIVIMSPIGYSPIGEIFNLSFESSASKIASSIQAEKLIYITENNGVQNIRGEFISEMTSIKLNNLISHIKESEHPEFIEKKTLPILEGAAQGLREGLAKIHLVNRHINGSLIMELFTNQGQGTVITPEKIEKFRSANIQDAKVIEKMINPLIKTQIIADRSIEKIEMEIQHFHILEFDNKILGCAQVKHYDGISEIACFAINENYQNMGYGKKLLEYCENECKKVNNKTFIMTTQSSHWFMENDFKQGNINDLPDEKKREYSPQRNSKIFLKQLEQ